MSMKNQTTDFKLAPVKTDMINSNIIWITISKTEKFKININGKVKWPLQLTWQSEIASIFSELMEFSYVLQTKKTRNFYKRIINPV